MTSGTIWDRLGIARTSDRAEIRRAYARQLKVTNPEDDPEGFQALRAAYEAALSGHTFIWSAPAPAPRPPKSKTLAPNSDAPKPASQGPASSEASLPEPVVDKPPQTTEDVPLRAPEPPKAPPPPPNPRKEHGRLQSTLDRLLRKRDTQPDAIFAAYKAILNSEAMGAIDVESTTEEWLAGLIASRAPQSDSLIPLAISRFKWRDNSLRRRHPPAVQRVLGREKDLVFKRELLDSNPSFRGAWQVLSRPFQPITLRWRMLSGTTPSAIRNLIEALRTRHPSLLNDLDRDTVQRWEHWLTERPRLASWGLRTVAVSPVCLLLLVLGQLFLPLGVRGLSILLIIPPAFATVAVFNTFVMDTSRVLWTERRHRAPSWLRFGWAPLLLLSIGLAAIPKLPLAPWPVIVLGGLAVIWARTTSDPAGRADRVMKEGFGNNLLLIFWAPGIATTLALGQWMQFLAAATAAVLVRTYGGQALHRLYASLSPLRRFAVISTVFLVSLGAIAILLQAESDPAWRLTGVSAVLATIVLYRPIVTQVQPLWLILRVAIFIAMLAWTSSEAAYPLVLFGGVAWTLWSLVGAATEFQALQRRA